MEPLAAFDPQAEVSGRAMLALVKCVVADDILPLLEQHHLEYLQPDAWYPIQTWLGVFRELLQRGFSGTLDLVGIGMKYVETAYFPPEITTLEDALIATNDTYQLNHRNGYVGELSIVIMGEGHIQVIDHTPYPQDFTYGMLYGLAHRFKPQNVQPIVRHDDLAPCRRHGDDSCTYDITW